MNYSGQGAIEYLLITAAAILVVAVVILAITSAVGEGEVPTDTSSSAFDALKDKLNEESSPGYFSETDEALAPVTGGGIAFVSNFPILTGSGLAITDELTLDAAVDDSSLVIKINAIVYDSTKIIFGSSAESGTIGVEPSIGRITGLDLVEGATITITYVYPENPQTSSVCTGGEEDCLGINYLFCDIDSWENQGAVSGECGVECINGDDSCLVADYLFCENNVWDNKGPTLGECGAVTMNGGAYDPSDPIITEVISLWSFESNYNDSVGGHNGTCVAPNCPTLSTGIIGAGAMDFTGDYKHLAIGDVADYKVGAKTISFWGKLNSGATGLNVPFSLGSINYYVAINSNTFYGYFGSPVDLTSRYVGDPITTPNDWHFYTFVFDADPTGKPIIRVYLDGVEHGAHISDVSGYGGGFGSIATLGNFDPTTYDQTEFRGSLDEVIFWGRVLTPGEISTLWDRSQ